LTSIEISSILLLVRKHLMEDIEMGATDFMVRSKGNSAKEAFQKAVSSAQMEYGNGGYSGSIAEKRNFIMIEVPEGKDPIEYAEELIDDEDSKVNDKWGPAGCFDLGNGSYLFFGWASD
jgi:hypothetical protein